MLPPVSNKQRAFETRKRIQGESYCTGPVAARTRPYSTPPCLRASVPGLAYWLATVWRQLTIGPVPGWAVGTLVSSDAELGPTHQCLPPFGAILVSRNANSFTLTVDAKALSSDDVRRWRKEPSIT